MDYCDRRIALWQKYKTDLAIRMLPSEVRGRSGSHSGSRMSNAMHRVMDVAMKPRSRAASQSRSRVESSVVVDDKDKDKDKEIKNHVNSRNVDITPLNLAPYSSNTDGTNDSLRTGNSTHRNAGGGAGGKNALAPILSGHSITHSLSVALLSYIWCYSL